MPLYKCDICNYNTERKSNLYTHNKSKKHLLLSDKKLNNIQTIPKLKDYEQKIVINTSNMDDAQDINVIKSLKNKIRNLEYKEKQYMRKYEELNNKYTNCIINHDKEKQELLNRLIDSVTHTTKQKPNSNIYNTTFNFISKFYADAPPIKYTTDRNVLEEVMSCNYNLLPIDNTLPDCTNDTLCHGNCKRKDLCPSKHAIAIDLIQKYDEKKNTQIYSTYVQNVITKFYKKEKPSEQSMWNSDVNRFTYVLKEIIESQDQWVIDKKGLLITDKIVKPILQCMGKSLISYDVQIKNDIIQYVKDTAKELQREYNLELCKIKNSKYSKTDIKKYNKLFNEIINNFDIHKHYTIIFDMCTEMFCPKKYDNMYNIYTDLGLIRVKINDIIKCIEKDNFINQVLNKLSPLFYFNNRLLTNDDSSSKKNDTTEYNSTDSDMVIVSNINKNIISIDTDDEIYYESDEDL